MGPRDQNPEFGSVGDWLTLLCFAPIKEIVIVSCLTTVCANNCVLTQAASATAVTIVVFIFFIIFSVFFVLCFCFCPLFHPLHARFGHLGSIRYMPVLGTLLEPILTPASMGVNHFRHF